MKNRGKSVKSEQYKAKFFSDSIASSSSSIIACKKHPLNSSTVGICAYCVNEKLIKLVCTGCGKQRISCSSCSDFSDLNSYRASSCNLDVGSVGRHSFLIENEKGSNGEEQKTLFSHLKLKQSETEDVVLLKRSSSCVLEVKKSNVFWRIGKFFRKKRDKEDQKSDVSRSRSLSSFMGGKSHHENGSVGCSSAKISDFNESEPANGGFKGGMMDFVSGFTVKDTDLCLIDDDHDDNDEFIELNIELSEKLKTEQSVFKKYDQLDLSDGDCGNDKGITKMKNSHMKSWKWTVKPHSGNNDHSQILKY